jgi:hypothetical protein
MDDLQQCAQNFAYRIGYRAAWRCSEILRCKHAFGEELPRSVRIRDELVGANIRRIGIVDVEDLEAIREGMNDAIEGRQPRW